MKYLYVIMTAILAVVLGISSRRAMATPLSCSEDNQFCRYLAALVRLQKYQNDITSNIGYQIPSNYLPADLEGNLTPIFGKGTKRQDVDHVFLRFGRRR